MVTIGLIVLNFRLELPVGHLVVVVSWSELLGLVIVGSAQIVMLVTGIEYFLVLG
jgi:hypothetical protein